MPGVTPESTRRLELARRIVPAYAARGLRAAILTGSAAEGISDIHSDLDLIAYYDALPSNEALRDARERLGAANVREIAPREEDAFAEQFELDGVVVQIAHTTIAGWEREMASVLEELDVTSPTQKALQGVLDALPLHGDHLIAGWKTRLGAYPDALARRMVEHHLAFFPLWRVPDRDATVWRMEETVKAAQNVLAVLAGLNRLYFSTFQFKRMRRFVAKMALAPTDLADRIERLFAPGSAEELRRLIADTVALVEARMPEVDTGRVRRSLQS